MSSTYVIRLVRNTWPRPDSGWGRTRGVRRQCSSNAGGALCMLTRRNWSPSVRSRLANLASHRRVAFASMASKTGCGSPGDVLMTLSTSEVAVCCSSASASSRERASSFFPIRGRATRASFPTRFGVRGRARRASSPSFRSNEACGRAFGSSRLCETRSPRHVDRPKAPRPGSSTPPSPQSGTTSWPGSREDAVDLIRGLTHRPLACTDRFC